MGNLSYNWISQPTSDSPDKLKKIWQDELQIQISDEHWEKASVFTHKCSLSTRIQEKLYKIHTQWYTTPAKNKKLVSSRVGRLLEMQQK